MGQGKGNNGKGGSKGNGQEGSAETGLGEAELQEIFEIYKEQQTIRKRLEEQLQNLINSEDRKLGERLVKQMEDFENDLLRNGLTHRTNTKMNQIQHQLMKLENATLKQGRDSKRESNSSKSEFTNPILSKPSFLDNYNNEIEILNRQALPLRQNFQNRVKDYFKGND